MTWEILVGLVTLVPACIAICTVVSNNTKAMTEVKCGLDELKSTLRDQKKELRSIEETVADHEVRITRLEG
ncbi:MAG: hypothetical protein UHZ05_01845 [Acutalibacteraceae bacterium]|nr:hypothetical protein [Clostridia bacterium]MEE1126972.1 hypothetical protein [Acutalibacteraceae bacterium]MBQ2319114.1 hypothetical protein [Clostridia bacterium]MBQ2420297.1 hypothetical protein [Clostridia bacterium]MBQ5597683.1 hypothetical protein [Clostridia bacterium]